MAAVSGGASEEHVASMRVSIGILAYNEASSITKTIRSLAEQSFVQALPPDVELLEIVCVPNGCTDDTAQVAGGALGELKARGQDARIAVRVEPLERGGKTNAWNEYVHRLSDQRADFLVLMDGDIRVHARDTLLNCVRTLASSSDASLSYPRAIKTIELSPQGGLREFLSLQLGRVNRGRPSGWAGCMYCLRGSVARRVWFPLGMIGEDAFLHGLVLTDLCRSEGRHERVVPADDATVVFEPYLGVRKMYRVLRRQAVTRGLNAMLWTYLWANVGELDAGGLIRRRSEEDPEWFPRLIRDEVARKGLWVMPKGVILRRLRYLQNLPLRSRLALGPWALLGVLADLVITIDANWRIRSGQTEGLWETTRTTQI